MRRLMTLVGLLLALATPAPLRAQTSAQPLYRVFLADGTGLASFGEWARVDDRVIFSMPLTPGAGPSDLHLVSLPVSRIDMVRTERYANSVRAANYASNRGESDFAALSGEVARTLNQIAIIDDPKARLATAERARRLLADWPRRHFGYRVKEVREFVGILDEIIAGLRVSAGDGRYDLALAATTTEAPEVEPLLPPPDDAEVIRGLMAASQAVDAPAEKVSLLQTVAALVDRAVDLLPESFAKAIRATALGSLAEEQQIERQYARLRTTILTEATQHATRADVRGLERLRKRVEEQDASLGQRRPDDVLALVATLDAELDAARRLRLAQDQWLIRADRMRQYQSATTGYVATLAQSASGLDEIRAMAGPSPLLLRPLARRLDRNARMLALVEPPPELASVHALFRSAFTLAANAVQLRLDAASAADVELARQAAAAASGAMMLLDRARADLTALLKPPLGQ
jgi:hypothetical protein